MTDIKWRTKAPGYDELTVRLYSRWSKTWQAMGLGPDLPTTFKMTFDEAMDLAEFADPPLLFRWWEDQTLFGCRVEIVADV